MKKREKIILDYPYFKTTSEVREIVDFWNTGIHTIHHLVSTRGVSDTVRLLESWMKRKRITVKQAKLAIRRFDLLFEKGVLKHKNRCSIYTFFAGNNYSGLSTGSRYKEISSKTGYKKLKAEMKRQEKYELICKRLRIAYAVHVLGEDRSVKIKYSFMQERKFYKSAMRLYDFIKKKGRKRMQYIDNLSLDDFIRILFSCLHWYYRERGFGIGHLCSDYTFNEILPKYITFQQPGKY